MNFHENQQLSQASLLQALLWFSLTSTQQHAHFITHKPKQRPTVVPLGERMKEKMNQTWQMFITPFSAPKEGIQQLQCYSVESCIKNYIKTEIKGEVRQQLLDFKLFLFTLSLFIKQFLFLTALVCFSYGEFFSLISLLSALGCWV